MKNYNFLNDLRSGKFADMVKEEIKGETLNTSLEVFNVMKPLFGKNTDVESMYCIFLNAKNRVVSIELVSEGTLTAASVYPREIVKRALAAKAASIIMVHNHPSGDPAPSPDDSAMTLRMVVAMTSIGITLHEHLIVGASTFFSFADQGFIASFRRRYAEFLH